MGSRQKRIRSVPKALAPLIPETRFRVVVPVAGVPASRMCAAGFSAEAEPGDTILPTPVGPVSTYNANGRYVALRDLPKEYRYVVTIEWTWQQWNGPHSKVEQTEDKAIYKWCYQREFLEPPSSELSIADHEGQLLVSSEELRKTPGETDRVRHVLNLFLELFGEYEIRHVGLQSIVPSNIRKVNWRLLPPGQYPWRRVREHVAQVLQNAAPRHANPIYRRIDKVASFNPEEVYFGQGGFRSYVAYIFKSRALTVLESVMLDNATYVLGQDWHEVSQMTKAEIIRGDLHLGRLIHGNNWAVRIDELLG